MCSCTKYNVLGFGGNVYTDVQSRKSHPLDLTVVKHHIYPSLSTYFSLFEAVENSCRLCADY